MLKDNLYWKVTNNRKFWLLHLLNYTINLSYVISLDFLQDIINNGSVNNRKVLCFLYRDCSFYIFISVLFIASRNAGLTMVPSA